MVFLRPLSRRITIGLTVPALYVSHQIIFPRRSYILQCQTAPYLHDRMTETGSRRRYIEEGDGDKKRGVGPFGVTHYRQLSLGSFSGVIAGYFVGRLSRMIAFVSLLVLLVVQYLERHGYRVIPRKQRLTGLFENADTMRMLTENAAFKYSFASAFALSAWFAN